MIWQFIHLIDILLWLFLAGSVLYVVFFALASLFNKKPRHSGSPSMQPRLRRFLVLFPAYKEDRVIVRSVVTFLQQDYPSSHYQVAVISDSMQTATNEQLSALPITLLQPTFEKSSKARALQYAIAHTASDFDNIVILDADNLVQPNFLSQLHAVCDQGYRAIQCHRMAKNANNAIAMLDGVSEEINNTLFRRAHNNIGLSSALIGSGMCFDYQWFCNNISALTSAVEDRELEACLLQQNVYIKYEENISIMDEKVSSQENFQRQRLRWMTGQVQTLCHMLPQLPGALRHTNLNYIDKVVQQMLIPRAILLCVLFVMSLLMLLVSPPWSLKWWLLLLCFSASLFISIPSRLRTHALLATLPVLPRLVWQMLRNLRLIDRRNDEFIHTTHDK
jgi:cellulose synthase/poly-beta-1,6-N-acetylglucosamine synthase-like glycosyltransferase